MYPLPNWPNKSPKWDSQTLEMLDLPKTIPSDVNLEIILNKSEGFPVKFPIDTVRCKTLQTTVEADILERNINSAYPLIHENALHLCAQFLLHKRKNGTVDEQPVYKNMTISTFIDRLLTKRAVVFMGKFDSYLLVNRTKGAGKWELIGKDPRSRLSLDNCLSYDEIKLSAFLSVSSYSYFVNDGTRKNMGKVPTTRRNVQDEGVVIGLIGARLKKAKVMEYEEMVITKAQNIEGNGYGEEESLHSVLANFYEEPCFTYGQVLDQIKAEPNRFTALGDEEFFDNVVFAKRIALSIDTLLIEANERAHCSNTTAFIHVVGIGLGVWKCSPHQEQVFVEVFGKRLESLGKLTTCISDIYFSYINAKQCNGCKSGEIMKIKNHPNGIKIHIGKRDPHVKLSGSDEGKLLIVSYAWDGNALPGNEFWLGKLGSTGDSAAAASTQITEIHNCHINPKICAANLRIVTSDGLKTFEEYVRSVKCGKRKLEG